MPPFEGEKQLRVRAFFVGQRINVRALERAARGAVPLVIPVGDDSYAAVFRWGAVVLFEPPGRGEEPPLDWLEPIVIDPVDEPETEEVDIRVAPEDEEGVDREGVIHLHDASLVRLKIVADVLAKSVALAHHEEQIADVFDQIEPVAAALRLNRRSGAQGRRLLAQIGNVLLIQHKMVGRVEVAEKPETLWDRPDLERLHALLQDEYEVRERDLALERKLALISRTAETSLEVLQNRRALRVEWYIVILILVEILIMLYDMAGGYGWI
jgi:uncharacterized Rmd1/YagE family protein